MVRQVDASELLAYKFAGPKLWGDLKGYTGRRAKTRAGSVGNVIGGGSFTLRPTVVRDASDLPPDAGPATRMATDELGGLNASMSVKGSRTMLSALTPLSSSGVHQLRVTLTATV